MTLPGLDLSALVSAVTANTVQLKRIADALTDQRDHEIDEFKKSLESRYRQEIDSLKQRVPDFGHTFPAIKGPIRSGGLGEAPTTDVESV